MAHAAIVLTHSKCPTNDAVCALLRCKMAGVDKAGRQLFSTTTSLTGQIHSDDNHSLSLRLYEVEMRGE